MALELYRKKRDFAQTPEPQGQTPRGSGKSQGLAFTIQKHKASHLHYDFRLELDGVLLSWAVPKGPSLDPNDRRLAMHVEDHPLEYGDFEGVIPPNQYGSGTVLLWDRGHWTPDDPNAAEAYRKGKLKFHLEGEKLHGGWILVRTSGGKYGAKGNSWFLIKADDEFARSGPEAHVDERPLSVASGRSLEEITADPDRVWHSGKSVADNVKHGAVKKAKPRLDAAKLRGARPAKLPQELAPELATLVTEVPAGDDWLHEIKYDGYRMLCRIEDGLARMFSRNGKEWSAALEPLVRAAARLPLQSGWLDGEVVVLESDGRSSFQALQNAMSGEGQEKLVYFLFDLPFANGYDLRELPLTERKQALKTLLPEVKGALRYSAEYEGSGERFFKEACAMKLEGIVSKRRDSRYLARRSRHWVKVKCGLRQEFVIGGWTDPAGSRVGLGALLLGVHDEQGALRYCGKVGTGFDGATLRTLRTTLDKVAAAKPAFTNPPRGAEARRAHWVKPELVAEIAFTEWTREGTVRHPSFQGLREDKRAAEVVRELPAEVGETSHEARDGDAPSESRQAPLAKSRTAPPAKSLRTPPATTHTAPPADSVTAPPAKLRTAPPATTRAASRRGGGAADSGDRIAGVKLTHPEKVLYPEAGLSKRDLALYYTKVAPWIVPHLAQRPLTLVRCPNGWQKPCFYQKHAHAQVPAGVDQVEVPEAEGPGIYMMANSITGVVGLLQLGVLELHPWGSTQKKLDRPDRIIFDFDPDEGLGWQELVEAVNVLKALLDQVGLESFLKTTGGKGLHVVLPIEPKADWEPVKQFSRAVAELMVRTFPDRFTAKLAKAQRGGKIFVDYLRNGKGSTAVAPFSIRAKANAPVSTPIAWEELAGDVRFDHFNVRNVPSRLEAMKRDPWADFFSVRQAITPALARKVGG